MLAAKQAFAAQSPDSRVGPSAVPSLLSAAPAAPRLVAVQTRAAKQKSLRCCCSLPGARVTLVHRHGGVLCQAKPCPVE